MLNLALKSKHAPEVFPSMELKDELKGLHLISCLHQGQLSELGLAQGPHPNLGKAPGCTQAVTSPPVSAKLSAPGDSHAPKR